MNMDTTVHDRWTLLETRRGDLLDRHEKYCQWTDPTLFKSDDEGSTEAELLSGNVVIGNRLLAHLAHRLVQVMFPADGPFFSLDMTDEGRERIEEEEDGEVLEEVVRNAISNAPKQAMRNLDMTTYRPVAIKAASLVEATGNATIFRDADGVQSVYTTRDYVCRRELNGTLREITLRDTVLWGDLSPDVQTMLQATNDKKQYKDDTKVNLYKQFKLIGKRWELTQALDRYDLPEIIHYSKTDFPCRVLVWGLGRGDHYGRGLVEQNHKLFQNLDAVHAALLDLVGIASDLKFFVRPGSMTDIEELNEAARGAYVAGSAEDVTVPDVKIALNLEILSNTSERMERELATIFLLNSRAIRDAERVTAEEIRMFAREFESAFGGIYARFAVEWQKAEAEYLLSKTDWESKFKGVDVSELRITSGLESLSKEGDLENLRLSIGDLQLMDTVPEEFRRDFDPNKYAQYIFSRRGIDAAELMYSEDQKKQIRAAEAAQQQQIVEQEAMTKVATNTQ